MFDLGVEAVSLYCEPEDHIYMHLAERFIIDGKKDHVCLLKNFLYGLKQSPNSDTFIMTTHVKEHV